MRSRQPHQSLFLYPFLALINVALGEGLPVPGFPAVPEPPKGPDRILATPDGKIIVSGGPVNVPGRGNRQMVRLNRDGELDPGFDPIERPNTRSGTGVPFVRQPDGLLIVARPAPSDFRGGSKIQRLDSDGAADPSWRPRFPYLDGAVNDLALWGNLGVYAAGDFQYAITASGFPAPKKERRSQVARINLDGSLDNAFVPRVMTSGMIFSMLVQPDARILVAGEIWLPESSQYSFILRLETDGSLDPNFRVPFGLMGVCYSIKLQSDGSILYRLLPGSSETLPQFGRLTPTGELDAGFAPRIEGVEGTAVTAMAVQGDQRIVIAGLFKSVNGVPRNGIARLFPDGRLDPDFDPGTGANAGIGAIELDWNGDLLVGGGFTQFNGQAAPGLARLECEDRIPPPNLHFSLSEVPLVHFSPLSPLKTYRMESASSLSANDWSLVWEGFGTSGLDAIADPGPPAPSRIYRMLVR